MKLLKGLFKVTFCFILLNKFWSFTCLVYFWLPNRRNSSGFTASRSVLHKSNKKKSLKINGNGMEYRLTVWSNEEIIFTKKKPRLDIRESEKSLVAIYISQSIENTFVRTVRRFLSASCFLCYQLPQTL